MLQKMSDEHKIGFLGENKSPSVQKTKDEKQQKTIKQLAEEQKAKRLDHKDNGMMTIKHISSARTGVVKDTGGPSKYVKSETSNSIFDAGKNARVFKEVDSKTKTIQEKENIIANRRDAEQKRMDDLAKELKNTEQRKASSISPMGVQKGSNYKLAVNSMSIFDTEDFERVVDKTPGEQITEDTQKRNRQVDDSWRGGGKSITSKEAKDKFFDSLLQKKEN